MKKVKGFNIILNIISISLYVVTTLFSSWLLVNYSIEEKTEGSGILLALCYVINSFECLILIILNSIGIVVTILNKDKVINEDNHKSQYHKQLLSRVIMIIVPILTFIIQIIINQIIN